MRMWDTLNVNLCRKEDASPFTHFGESTCQDFDYFCKQLVCAGALRAITRP